MVEVGEVAELGGYWSGQPAFVGLGVGVPFALLVQVQVGEVGELAELGWYWSDQLILAQV